MYGGISLIGWFHTIVGTAGIISGIYLLIYAVFSIYQIFLIKGESYNYK
jgi:hypothetical protein